MRGFGGGDNFGEDEVGEEEVADVVGGELDLEAIWRQRAFGHVHYAGVVDEEIDTISSKRGLPLRLHRRQIVIGGRESETRYSTLGYLGCRASIHSWSFDLLRPARMSSFGDCETRGLQQLRNQCRAY